MPRRQINLSQYHTAKRELKGFAALQGELTRECQALADSQFERSFRGEFSWAPLYEFPFRIQFALQLIMLGKANEIVNIFDSSLDPLSDVQSLFLSLASTEGAMDAAFDYVQTVHHVSEYLSVVHALGFQIQCRKSYGVWIGDLLARGAAGEDASFIKALRVDPTVVACTAFANRLSMATMRPRDKFLDLVARTISLARAKSKGQKQSKQKALPWNSDWTYLLFAKDDVDQTQDFSMREVDRLLFQEIAQYLNSRSNRDRDLIFFISCFKNRYWASARSPTPLSSQDRSLSIVL